MTRDEAKRWFMEGFKASTIEWNQERLDCFAAAGQPYPHAEEDLSADFDEAWARYKTGGRV